MKNQNDKQHGGDSEGTPLLQRQQHQQSQQETATFTNAYEYPQPVGPPQLPMNMNGNNQGSMTALATLAAQYEQAGYPPSDAAFAAASSLGFRSAASAAASMAAYQQQQQQMYAAASAFGYPPHTQAPMYYPSQAQQYVQTSTNPSTTGAPIASSLSPGAPSSSRPPRSSRRASSPILSETGNGNNSNSLPSLQDIFRNNDSATNTNIASNNSNYGSVAQTSSPIWSAPPHAKSPTTSNYASGGAKRVAPMLVRTSSSGAIGRLPNSPKQAGTRGHRRSSSDLPINRHRRTGSGESPVLLPPIAGGGVGHRRSGSFGTNGTGSSVISGSDRQRALSAGSLSRSRRGSGHRRTASAGSVATFTSQLSTSTVLSNIAKSSMFGGFDPHTGQVQLHFPFEAVRLVFVDDEQDANLPKEKYSGQLQPIDPHAMLTQGHLYSEGWPSDFENFEDYTNITNAMEEGMTPQWETLDRVTMNDRTNLDMNSIIKPPSYLLPVSAKVYKRMVGEISDAHYMPCGLFFCGHHEDVSHPSIAIAVAIVILLFGFMAYVAFFIEGS